MKRALALARRGKGKVEPNPMVGAVIVKNGRKIGEGYHRRFGEAHAEVNALAQAGRAARGATIHVTLEPCCHHGKTPPCTDALIEAGIAEVFVAMIDPFPANAGRGVRILRRNGMRVHVGLLEDDARRLNAPFVKLTTTGEPYVIAKWAMTVDGKIATRTGDARWISCETSRKTVHKMRHEADAILVGVGTVLQDNPLLTCRRPRGRNPVRIIVDSRCRTPVSSQLLQTIEQAPVIIATTPRAPRARRRRLQGAGADVLVVEAEKGHRSVALKSLARALGAKRMTNVLVEGGSRLLGSAFAAGIVDEVAVFIAPKIIGDARAIAAVAGPGTPLIADATSLADVSFRRSGSDVLIRGRVVHSGS